MNRKTKPHKSEPHKKDDFFVKPSVAQKIREERERVKQEKRQHKTNHKFSNNTKYAPKTEAAVKKPFDKKQWRLQKYSKKHKIEEWEEKRRKFMTRRYNKELKKQPKFDVNKIYEETQNNKEEEEEEEPNFLLPENPKKRGKKSYASRIENLEDEREKARQEAERRRAEKKAALEAYKKKKHERNRILGKKTSKGQPLMKGRMELLLKEIEEKCANS